MVIIKNDLQKFWEYLKEAGNKYFGREYISPEALLMFYLEYDTSRNFLRKKIIEQISETEYSHINYGVVQFMHQLPEENSLLLTEEKCFNNFCKLCVSHSLADAMKHWAKGFENCTEEKNVDIDCFMYEVLFLEQEVYERISKLLEEVFCVKSEVLRNQYAEYIGKKEEKNETKLNIPNELKDFVCEINGNSSDYDISYKSFDITKNVIYAMLQKRKVHNINIKGGFAVGKKTLIYRIASEIANGKCPDFYLGYKIVKVDLLKMLSGRYDVKVIEKLGKRLVEFLDKQEKIIVFVDNFYQLNFDNPVNNKLGFTIYSILINPKYRTIITQWGDHGDFMQSEHKMLKSFINVNFMPPEKEELRPALKTVIKMLTYYHGVYLTEEMLNLSILYNDTFRNSEYNFLSIKDSLDVEMANARNEHRYLVNETDIKFMYIVALNEYNKYTEEYKRSTAIHESGHYVVTRFCQHYQVHKVKLISIVPTGDAAGFNLLEYDQTKIKDNGYDFYTEMIASYLGGRAAEELFVKSISAGASSDLEMASDIARLLITDLSLDRRFGKERIQVNESLQSDTSVNRVDKKANKIIGYSYKMALDMLSEHKDYVMGLANLLLEKCIVSSEEIKSHEQVVVVEKLVRGKKIQYETVMWVE